MSRAQNLPPRQGKNGRRKRQGRGAWAKIEHNPLENQGALATSDAWPTGCHPGWHTAHLGGQSFKPPPNRSFHCRTKAALRRQAWERPAIGTTNVPKTDVPTPWLPASVTGYHLPAPPLPSTRSWIASPRSCSTYRRRRVLGRAPATHAGRLLGVVSLGRL